MKLNDRNAGMWKRTFNIYRSFKIPWFLYLFELLLGIVTSKVSLLLIPYSTKIQTGEITEYEVIGLFIGITLLIFVIETVGGIPKLYSQEIVSRNLRNKLIAKIIRLPLDDFEEQKASQLVSRVTYDTLSADEVLAAIVAFITGAAATIMTFDAMNGYNQKLSLIMIVVLFYAIFCYWLQGRLFFLGDKRIKKSFALMTGYFSERTADFKGIKYLGAEYVEEVNGSNAVDEMYHADIYQTIMITINQFFSGSLMQVVTFLTFILGAGYVRAGVMTIQEVVAFQTAAIMELGNVAAFPQFYISLMKANGTLFYVGKIMDAKEEVVTRKYGMDREDESIVFENVSFSYKGNLVLQDLNLSIPRGKTTALVGMNGSGKSTILKLIERLYSPQSGTIKFGNINIEEINLDEWRQSFGYVLQDTALVSGTIKENMLYGVERLVSEEELIYVSKIANAYDFIMELPDKFEYEVGADGGRLSGGQRQRIAVARAIMLDPSMILLDEATSNLDIYSEKSVTQAIEQLMENRTSVIVTHHLKTIERADQIIVLNKGAIEAIGSHEQLLSQCITYQKLINAQKGGEVK